MKRFTDTGIWDKPWFRKLPPEEKEALRFIKDRCDNVGVWVPDFEAVEFFVTGGKGIDWDHLRANCNNNIQVLKNKKWFLVDFVAFQYGELRETCKPHLTYISLLKKHRLWEEYLKGMNTLQDKDKEQDIDKDKEKEQEKDALNVVHGAYVRLAPDSYIKLKGRYGKPMVDDYIHRINEYCHKSRPDGYLDYYRTIGSWIRKDKKGPTNSAYKICDKGHEYVGDFCRKCRKEEMSGN